MKRGWNGAGSIRKSCTPACWIGVWLTWLGLGLGSLHAEEPLRVPVDRVLDILHIRLDLDVSLEKQTISGTATIEFEPNRPVSSFSLDSVGLDISTVRQLLPDGQPAKPLDFENTGKHLVVSYDDPLPRDQKQTIEITYQVQQPRSGLHFFQPTQTEPETPWMVWSQGEPEANRYWFPCFDHPHERQTTELIARVDRQFTVLSNGKLMEKKPVDGGKRTQFHWKQDKPHVSYLVTLVVGEFAIVEQDWRGRPVTYYVPPQQKNDAQRTFGRTLEMLDYFSERFGIEYPWEKYAQVVVEQFTSGGMENTSATTLYDGVIHDERALLDSTPDRLIAHELGHQWWGDLVTCRDWSHLWLNEGFATYCEVLWYEHKLGRDERDYLLYQKSSAARSGSTKERPIVDRRYSAPRTMFDNRAYPKGGWVLHMLRSQMGDADFFRGLKRYGLEYSFRTAETSDFRKVFENLYGVSLERFFHDWTERKGHPQLHIKTTYQAADGFVKVDVEQRQQDEAFHFPLTIELTNTDEAGQSTVISPFIQEKKQTFLVPVKQRPELVRIDPEFTLLAEIEEEKSRSWWVAQLMKGPSVPERLRAVEHFGKSHEAADQDLLIACLEKDPFYAVRAQIAKALDKKRNDRVRKALLAGIEQNDPRVRRACLAALGQFEGDKSVETALKDKHEQGDPSYYVEAEIVEALAKITKTPDRALLTACLGKDSHRDVIRTKALNGLSRCADVAALETLAEWTRLGRSRTARMAAMQALASALNRHEFPKEKQTDSVKLFYNYLDEPGPRIRRAALQALAEIPHLAPDAKQRIASMAQHDADGRVRVAAETALKKFDDDKPASDHVKKLQTELEQLKEQYKKLEEKLQQIQNSSPQAQR